MSGQVLIDQCDGTSHVRTKTCGNIECATNRKNITNQKILKMSGIGVAIPLELADKIQNLTNITLAGSSFVNYLDSTMRVISLAVHVGYFLSIYFIKSFR